MLLLGHYDDNQHNSQSTLTEPSIRRKLDTDTCTHLLYEYVVFFLMENSLHEEYYGRVTKIGGYDKGGKSIWGGRVKKGLEKETSRATIF